MSRAAREKSESGFYHVLLRGIGKQNIFEDDEDRQRFIDTISRYKQEMKFEVHAYCLMGNHVHLLLKDVNRQLDLIMKKVAGSYVYYFNWKYERVGHLFQDRFRSEPVNDDAYYLTVLRYIHQNPQKAGIAETNQYKWSSYSEYMTAGKIVNTELALNLLGGLEQYVEFMSEIEEATSLEMSDKSRLTDEKAIDIIKKRGKVKNAQDVQQLDREKRDEVLRILKEEGVSIRQIARLTGVNRGVVLKA